MDQLKSERIFNVYFKIITLLCVIYSFSQSAFARIMPYLDLAVSCCLILFWVITIIFNKALFTRLEILLLLAVVMFFPFMLVISSDVEYSIKRWFTLFCQLFCMYIFPISVYRGSRETVTIQADSSVKWIKRAISVIAIANVAIMLWGSITKNFVLYGFEIGNYISSRFSGFMTAPAAAGELSLVFLYAAYTAKDKSKFCRFAGILIFALTFWLTKARSMLIGGCIFFVIYYLLRKTKGRNTIFFLSCFAIVGALVLFGFVNGEDINEISSNRTEIWAYIISNGRGLLGNSLSSMAVEMNGELFEGGTHNSILQTA